MPEALGAEAAVCVYYILLVILVPVEAWKPQLWLTVEMIRDWPGVGGAMLYLLHKI